MHLKTSKKRRRLQRASRASSRIDRGCALHRSLAGRERARGNSVTKSPSVYRAWPRRDVRALPFSKGDGLQILHGCMTKPAYGGSADDSQTFGVQSALGTSQWLWPQAQKKHGLRVGRRQRNASTRRRCSSARILLAKISHVASAPGKGTRKCTSHVCQREGGDACLWAAVTSAPDVANAEEEPLSPKTGKWAALCDLHQNCFL